MFSLCTLALLAHVPTYNNCVDNCCKPPRDVDISQVMYLRGSGGLEIHLSELRDGQILNFDAVFRDEVDTLAYRLYVGCGGCMPEDPLVVAPYQSKGYQPVEVEPFTQTAYRSAFPPQDRTFDSAQLVNCSEGHFTVRLVTNRTDIVWGAVIGLAESFTFLELLQFPVYILRNHGDTWNELGYTYWLWLFVGAPLLLCAGRTLYHTCCGCYMPSVYDGEVSRPRELFYEIAFIGFIAAALEMLTHLVYVQVGHPVEGAFWVGLTIIIVPAALAETFLYATWYGLRKPTACKGWLSSPYWGPIEIVTGFSFLLIFGAGFYVGPAAIMLAGMVRLTEMQVGAPLPETGADRAPTTVVPRLRGYAGESSGRTIKSVLSV